MGAHQLREDVERRLALRRSAAQSRSPIATFPFAVGRFTVHSLIQEGGAGGVYRAHQDQPEREVALKLIWRNLGTADDQRLLGAELRALALLQHPGIVHLYDAGTVAIDGKEFPYLAMELVEGQSLTSWVDTAKPDLAAKLRLLIAVCAAVHAAHQRGVIHRDLKPDNVLVRVVDGEPHPCVLDFGVARISSDASQATAESGRVYGSLDCMSPEQAAGDPLIDVRSDVYSLGAMAYRILTGVAPVPTDALPVGEALQWIQNERPQPLSQRNRQIGRDLELVIGKALAKSREDRYASVQELAADLQAVVARRPISIRKHSAGYLLHCFARRQRALCAALVLAGLSALFALGLGSWGYARSVAELDRVLPVTQAAIAKMLEPLGTMAGTGQARRELMMELLPQVAECTKARPDNLQALQCQYDILRLIGDIDADDGRWSSALQFRMQARDLQRRILDRDPSDALARAEYATAMVRVGDAEARVRGELVARASYDVAHILYQALALQNPDSGRHIDDLGWSCDRTASLAIRFGQLDRAEELLRERARCNERLRVLRPGQGSTFSGERSLHWLSSVLARSRGQDDLALRELRLAIEPARAQHRLEPNSPLVTIDLCSNLVSFPYLSGSSMSLSAALEMLDEADRLLDGLLALEPRNEMGRKLRIWAECVRSIHLAHQVSEPVQANVLRAEARIAYANKVFREGLGSVLEEAVAAARGELAPLEALTQQPPELPQLQSQMALLEQQTLTHR